MPKLEFRPFEAADIAAAAELLAARQKRDRIAGPAGMEAAFERPELCIEHLLGPTAANPHASGVVAFRGGNAVGFLIGEKMMFGSAEFAALFVPPHSISIPIYGHAIAAGEDALALYGQMYAVLADEWVRGGFFYHQCHVFAGDGATAKAWASLGFGRHTVAAIRPAGAPIDAPLPAGVEFRRAAADDIDVVMDLSDELRRYHAGSPMFWPVLREPAAANRENQLAELANPDNAYFLAWSGGRPLGLQSYLVPGYRPAIARRAASTYLYEGVVVPEVRGTGIGAALLRCGLEWAREQGHEFCNLHYASGNLGGARFWERQGFVPLEFTLTRQVDERIAWANGR